MIFSELIISTNNFLQEKIKGVWKMQNIVESQMRFYETLRCTLHFATTIDAETTAEEILLKAGALIQTWEEYYHF